MSRRIVEVYFAAICFALTLSILFTAHGFFRARRTALYAKADADLELAGYKATQGRIDRKPLDQALKKLDDAGLEYEWHREYLLFVSEVMAGHLIVVVVMEAVFWHRSRRMLVAIEP